VELPVELEGDQVRFQVRVPAAHGQAEQRMIEHGAVAGRLGASQFRPGPGVPQVLTVVAAHVADVLVVRLIDGQVQFLAEQRKELGGAVGLQLSLERVAACEREL
jgi:hypothetical protein